MAQLLKIDDCYSRYQQGVSVYANRYIQLKDKRWTQWENAWENPEGSGPPSIRKQVRHAATKEILYERFQHFLLEHKILWATSTADTISNVQDKYLEEPWFDFSLRKFSDMAFLLYKPTMSIQNGLTQLETVLITPGAVWCLKGCYGEKESVFQSVNTRTWQELTSGGRSTRMNPMISLKQTHRIVSAAMKAANLTLPVHMGLIVPESYVEFVSYEGAAQVVDKRNLSDWLSRLAMRHATFKHEQLRAAAFLLERTSTVSQQRF